MQPLNGPVFTKSRMTAVLGPTNTGKTHTAIERMLEYRTGCIGFPLRLLARENYDRVVKAKGKGAVALVTGEEKIIPPDARYFLCTVEAMPVDQAYEFLAVDEIQLCADPDRGHVFTDRLLRARGILETMFMGADTAQHLLKMLVPGIDVQSRERLSRLTYTGFKKLTRLPKRSAVVAFSIDDVYSFAELVRRQRGGTAVVLGALSPRTRNRQVEMYQAGEVDFLVATDAIGMGLNMDIHHVALAATRKFDGAALRGLTKAEIGQIAGRAGRYKRDGTFGVTGPVRGFDDDVIEAVETHHFKSLEAFYWRNTALDFASPGRLVKSLEVPPDSPVLTRGRPSDDYLTLVALGHRDDILARAGEVEAVRLLWDICQIPDFRRTLSETHQELVAGVFEDLVDKGRIPDEKIALQLERLDKTDGDVDTLMARIAHVRTWTYITHKSEWLNRGGKWAEQALAVEDRLSDALHESLIRRFVDRRSAILLRAMEDGAGLLAGVRANGEVVVEGQEVGHLHGFKFIPDEDASGKDYRAVISAARTALKPEIKRRLKLMLTAEAKQFRLNDEGQILYQTDATNPLPGQPIAKVRKGGTLMQPDIDVLDSDLLDGQDKDAVAAKLKEWLGAHVKTVLEPLIALEVEEGEGVDGSVRGISFQLHEKLGIAQRSDLESLIAALTPEGRKVLRARKVRLGPVLVFIPDLNKPAAVRLRALLWNVWNDKQLPAATPPDGMTSLKLDPANGAIDADYYRAIGYPVYGPRAIRVDMLDRLISAIYDGSKDGAFQAKHQMAEWLGCPVADLYAVLEAMGHTKISDPADAPKPVVDETPAAETVAEPVVEPAVEVKAEDATPEGIQPEDAKSEAVKPDEFAAAAPEKKAPQPKPELATFRLRRGRAYGGGHQAGEQRAPRGERPAKKPYAGHKKDDKGGARKDAPRKDTRPAHDKLHGKPRGERSFRDNNRDKKGKSDHRDREDKVMFSAPAAKVGDSPFAALKQLKMNDKE
jgi:ATP-dependent RNA helicase SUPV3L1/SUV3